jgi:hypothetical protein
LTRSWPRCGRGRSDAIELTDVVDGTRTDLFERFERDPLARHDLEVQALVSGVRGSARIPRLVLARVAGGGWLLTEVGARRGEPPRLVSPRVFGDLRDAERNAFSLRLALLAALGPEREARDRERERPELPNGGVVPAAPPRPLPWVKTVRPGRFPGTARGPRFLDPEPVSAPDRSRDKNQAPA